MTQRPGLALLLFAALLANAHADVRDPQLLVDATIESLRGHVVRDAALIERDPGHALAIVETIISPHIDMELASRLVLGRHWKTASAAQRAAFVDGLERLLMRIFALHIRDYTDVEIAYAPTVFKGERQTKGDGTEPQVSSGWCDERNAWRRPLCSRDDLRHECLRPKPRRSMKSHRSAWQISQGNSRLIRVLRRPRADHRDSARRACRAPGSHNGEAPFSGGVEYRPRHGAFYCRCRGTVDLHCIIGAAKRLWQSER